jgi:hypothetical protein
MGLLANKKKIFFTIYDIIKEVDEDGRYSEYETSTLQELIASYKTRPGYKNLVEMRSQDRADWLIFEMAFTTIFYVRYGPKGVERAWAAMEPRLKGILRMRRDNNG